MSDSRGAARPPSRGKHKPTTNLLGLPVQRQEPTPKQPMIPLKDTCRSIVVLQKGPGLHKPKLLHLTVHSVRVVWIPSTRQPASFIPMEPLGDHSNSLETDQPIWKPFMVHGNHKLSASMPIPWSFNYISVFISHPFLKRELIWTCSNIIETHQHPDIAIYCIYNASSPACMSNTWGLNDIQVHWCVHLASIAEKRTHLTVSFLKHTWEPSTPTYTHPLQLQCKSISLYV